MFYFNFPKVLNITTETIAIIFHGIERRSQIRMWNAIDHIVAHRLSLTKVHHWNGEIKCSDKL